MKFCAVTFSMLAQTLLTTLMSYLNRRARKWMVFSIISKAWWNGVGMKP